MRKSIKWSTTVVMAAAVMSVSAAAQAAELKVVFSGGTELHASEIVAAYRKSRGGTKVTPITMGNGVDFTQAVEKKPDIYLGFFYEMSNYADIGLFEDVSKLVGPQVLREFPIGFSDAFAVGKRMLGLPVSGFTSGLHYNPDLFSKAGLARPDTSWTWTGKFMEACRKLSRDANGDGAREVYGVAGMSCNQFGSPGMPSPHFLSAVYSFGGQITDRKFTKVMYTEKPAMNAVNFVLQLHKEKLADMGDYTYDQADAGQWPFYSGQSAMMIRLGGGVKEIPIVNHSWAQGKAPKFKPAVSVVPKGAKGSIPANMAQVACIMSTAKNKKEAVEFLKWLAGEKGQTAIFDTTGGLPTSRKGFTNKKVEKALGSPMLKAYQNGNAWSARKGYIDIEFMLWNDMLRIARGEGTMAELLENAKTRGPEVISSSTYSWQ